MVTRIQSYGLLVGSNDYSSDFSYFFFLISSLCNQDLADYSQKFHLAPNLHIKNKWISQQPLQMARE